MKIELEQKSEVKIQKMKPYVIYLDSNYGQYVKGDLGRGYVVNYNSGSGWNYCFENEADILEKTKDTNMLIELDYYSCDPAMILAIENELDNESLAYLHKLDTFSKIPRLKALNQSGTSLPEEVINVLNMSDYLASNLYLSEACLYAKNCLTDIVAKIESGKTQPQDYNLTFDEYYLFNQLAYNAHLLYKVAEVAQTVRESRSNKDEWLHMANFMGEWVETKEERQNKNDHSKKLSIPTVKELNQLLRNTNITVCSEKGIDSEVDQILRDKFVNPYGTFYLYSFSEEKAKDVFAKLQKEMYPNNCFDTSKIRFVLNAKTTLGFEILDMSLSSMPEEVKRNPDYKRTIDNISFEVWPLLDVACSDCARDQNYADAVSYINKEIETTMANELNKVSDSEEKDM